ncbi:MAG: D-lyxose/D-mannose family sugar isomerase [bacterium]
MKRSEINAAVREAMAAFDRHDWALPPNPRWDVTDFGLGDFARWGLVLVNLAEQPEYCEKLMYARRNQVTPRHHHRAKKEDIICRWGRLAVQVHSDSPGPVRLLVNGEERAVPPDEPLVLNAGERITLTQEIDHSFWAESDYAIIGEVSSANDDLGDNFFANPEVGRFSEIEEDEPPLVRLVSD